MIKHYQDILPDVNINNTRLKAKERKCGGASMSGKKDTEKLIHDALYEIEKCVGSDSIYRECICIPLQGDGKEDKKMYPHADIWSVISFLNHWRGFNCYVVKKHPSQPNCQCGKDDPPCTKWLKIENNWE